MQSGNAWAGRLRGLGAEIEALRARVAADGSARYRRWRPRIERAAFAIGKGARFEVAHIGGRKALQSLVQLIDCASLVVGVEMHRRETRMGRAPTQGFEDIAFAREVVIQKGFRDAELVDDIGVQLDALGLQLEHIDPAHPAAAETRKLVGEHLPETVDAFRRIPQNLRREQSAGSTPEDQLVESLGKIRSEIDRVTRQLAAGALDDLAVRTRYLEYRYGDGPEGEKG